MNLRSNKYYLQISSNLKHVMLRKTVVKGVLNGSFGNMTGTQPMQVHTTLKGANKADWQIVLSIGNGGLVSQIQLL